MTEKFATKEEHNHLKGMVEEIRDTVVHLKDTVDQFSGDVMTSEGIVELVTKLTEDGMEATARVVAQEELETIKPYFAGMDTRQEAIEAGQKDIVSQIKRFMEQSNDRYDLTKEMHAILKESNSSKTSENEKKISRLEEKNEKKSEKWYGVSKALGLLVLGLIGRMLGKHYGWF